MMLGLGSLEIALAFWGTIIVTIFCVVYGAVNWNRSKPDLADSRQDSNQQ